MGLKSVGTCDFCGDEFASNAIERHLKSCKERIKTHAEMQGNALIFHFRVSAGPFWVHFEADGAATLKDVDDFLRDLWLECCGHCSMFTINGQNYSSHPESMHGDKSTNAKLYTVMRPGMSFSHEYDFGTTTYLKLKCVSKRSGRPLDDIEILARNEMPDFKCECKKDAKEICSACFTDGILCKPCAKKHECGEEMMLPLVNSPRTGMCGYTGN